MIPYLLLLLFVVVVAYAGRRSGSIGARRISVGVIMVALIAFAGLRHFLVGTDTGNYVRMYQFSNSFTSVMERPTEIGYNFLAWIAHSVSDSYSALLLSIAVVVVACYMSTIVKLTRRYETSLFLFITLGVYTFFFNGARQGIAAAICFAAIPMLLQRRWVPYLFMVVVAALFHKTAWIALLIYPLASPRIHWHRLALLAGSAAVLIIFLELFVDLAATLLDDRFAAYAIDGQGGGEVWVAFLFGQGAALYLLRKKVHDPEGNYGRLLNVYLIGLVPALASVVSGVNPSGLLRLHLYFSSTAVLLWPMVFLHLKSPHLRGIIGVGFLSITLVFFVLTTTNFSNLTPYRVNQELISDEL